MQSGYDWEITSYRSPFKKEKIVLFETMTCCTAWAVLELYSSASTLWGWGMCHGTQLLNQMLPLHKPPSALHSKVADSSICLSSFSLFYLCTPSSYLSLCVFTLWLPPSCLPLITGLPVQITHRLNCTGHCDKYLLNQRMHESQNTRLNGHSAASVLCTVTFSRCSLYARKYSVLFW